MDTYLVGGAVRDELLGLPVRERDWVVVGGTPEALAANGYTQVGKDFPVFLHPTTHEEYALARTERKTGPGYHGFVVRYSPDVTLEEDLRRRDLTVNAMARAADGRLIDPYGGAADLAARCLRHVSAAFTEDPVRILRLARFAARFASLGFRVAPETTALLGSMVQSGEADALVPERVWAETAKALVADTPSVYFRVLAGCGALARVYPELAAALEDPALMAQATAALDRAAAAHASPAVRFACVLSAIHDGAAIDALCQRGRVPNECRELGLAVRRALDRLQSGVRDAPDLLTFLDELDAFRRAERFREVLCAIDHVAPPGDRLATDRLLAARERAAAVALDPAERATLSGRAIGERLKERRRAVLTALLGAAGSGP